MKILLNFFLAFSALVLLVVHWQLHQQNPAVGTGKSSAEIPRTRQALSSPKATTESSDPNAELTETALAGPKPTLSRFDWAEVETTDYKEYVKRLRAVGFPAELIREIVIADVNKMYEAREEALNEKLVPYDAPMFKRQKPDISPDDWQRVKELWELRIEKQRAMESILDEYVPRDILRTLISRNYEAYEYGLSQLPPEKREPVQWAQETEIFTEGYNNVTISDPAAELESFKRTRAERDEAILKVLTPEEFDRYEMNTTPAGTELARRVIGMQPTDEEFLMMYRIAYKNWVDCGGVYGRWRAVPVPPEQIAAADLEMNESLRQALGSDRFTDYQMAINGMGQQMRNLAARFDLPRETMVQAFQLQSRLDTFRNVDATRLPEREQLRAQLEQVLGQQLYQTWNAGRNLRANLDP